MEGFASPAADQSASCTSKGLECAADVIRQITMSTPRSNRTKAGRGLLTAPEVNGKRQLEAAQSLAASRDMLGAASRWKPTLMIGPPPGGDQARNQRVKDLSAQLAKLCAALNVPYFDSYESLLASPIWLPSVKSVDDTHPSAAGYAEWAQLIDAWPAWREWLP